MEVWNLRAGVNGERIGARRGVNGAGNRECPAGGETPPPPPGIGGYMESLRFQLIVVSVWLISLFLILYG